MRIAIVICLSCCLGYFPQSIAQSPRNKGINPSKSVVLGMPEIPYEKSNFTQTATYQEAVSWYKSVKLNFANQCELINIGKSDMGRDIYVFHIKTLNEVGKNTLPVESNPVKIIINNNIHPGEPEGTDACMMLVRDILSDPHRFRSIRQLVDIYIVVQYNVDGTMQRGSYSRANQNGPAAYGFRATANNLDLNRDFVKCDSKNTQALEQFVSRNQFDFFIDNHTSNGADYQYTLTYFHTVAEKLPQHLVPAMALTDSLLKQNLNQHGWPTFAYVNTLNEVPDSGLTAFYESPRFATGWASTHGIIGFTVETHMLKPFHARVDATYAFLEQFISVVSRPAVIESLNNDIKREQLPSKHQYTRFKLDKSRYDVLPFLGYEFGYKPSGISGAPRLYYNRDKPKTLQVKYYHHFKPTDSVNMPQFYIIPKSRSAILERLKWNNVEMQPIGKDSLWKLKVSYIDQFKTVEQPYEGHYLHHDVSCRDTQIWVPIYKGDFLIKVTPKNVTFLAAVLEPKSPDSYFCWNFVDDVLQQKEGYSAYVFEDLAVEFLKSHPEIKQQLAEKVQRDPVFAKDPGAQLDFVYKHSPYYEYTHRLYPVFRALN